VRRRLPRFAAAVLSAFASDEEREFLLGDLEEQYVQRCRGSSLGARRWVWGQVLRCGMHALRNRGSQRVFPAPASTSQLGRSGNDLLQSTISDVRFALRSFRSRPGFAFTAIGLMGLGIGATTTIFSVVDTVLLRQLPYPNPESLVLFDNRPHSYPNFKEWRDNLTTVSTIGALSNAEGSVSGGQGAEHVWIAHVTPELLPMLGAIPHVGRLFTAQDQLDDSHMVMLGHGFWRQRWGGDPNVVGRQIRLDGQMVLVTGVLSSAFTPPQAITATGQVDVWKLLDENASMNSTRDSRTLGVVARLKDNISMEVAQAEVDALTAALAQEYPDDFIRADGSALSFPLVPFKEATIRRVSDTLLLLLGAVGLLLLIACANVASLFLARGTARAGEIALRGALGAGGLRIARQLLTESALLALFGAAMGVGFAYLGVRLFLVFNPGGIPRIAALAVDTRILVFAFAASVSTGVLCGVFPVFQALGRSAISDLRETAANTTVGARRRRLKNGLVVSELALTVILLTGSGLLFRSLLERMKVDPGFDTDGLVILPLELGASYDGPERSRFVRELSESIQSMQGTEAVAAGWTLPFVFPARSCCWASPIYVEGTEEDELFPYTFVHPVTPHYFESLGASMAYGREFTETDPTDSPSAAIINARLARRLFDTEDAVGKRFMIGRSGPLTVVGVESGVQHWSLDEEIDEAVYLQYHVAGAGFGLLHVAVRSSTPLDILAPALREIVRTLDPDLATDEITTMQNLVADSLGTPRFLSMLFGFFAAVALLLACGGIYASMLYSVGQRRREMGIRLALGAGGTRMTGMVLGEAAVVTGVGLVIGVAGAVAASRLMAGFVWGVSTFDPVTYLGVCILLSAVAITACWIPARRAARSDPLATLRVD